ncbi:MAG: response regulator [Defluviitaleaceae bacterium]|nr:response regulator [Defluviitaleaceae bacterium]
MQEVRKTIFLVDDELTNLKVGKAALGGHYNVVTLNSGSALFVMLENVRPDLILLDVNMPEMDGHEVITRLKTNPATSEIPVIFLTALNDEAMELKGLTLGAVDYIAKPFSAPLLLKRLEVHLLVENQKLELQMFNSNLQHMVKEKTAAVLEMKDAILSTMAELVEYRDEITGNHIVRVRKYLDVLMQAMLERDVYAEQIREMDTALVLQSSQLHDVGKIAISDTILNKPGKLTDEEFDKMRTHTTFGETVIKRFMEKARDSEFLEYARIIAVSHHEKWDGNGYPYKLSGEDIPLLGRIMAIADVYDALIQARPYKKAFSHEEAIKIILDGRGSHFDPKLVDLFATIHTEFEKIAAAEGRE